jgi:hypothetical protein
MVRVRFRARVRVRVDDSNDSYTTFPNPPIYLNFP